MKTTTRERRGQYMFSLAMKYQRAAGHRSGWAGTMRCAFLGSFLPTVYLVELVDKFDSIVHRCIYQWTQIRDQIPWYHTFWYVMVGLGKVVVSQPCQTVWKPGLPLGNKWTYGQADKINRHVAKYNLLDTHKHICLMKRRCQFQDTSVVIEGVDVTLGMTGHVLHVALEAAGHTGSQHDCTSLQKTQTNHPQDCCGLKS